MLAQVPLLRRVEVRLAAGGVAARARADMHAPAPRAPRRGASRAGGRGRPSRSPPRTGRTARRSRRPGRSPRRAAAAPSRSRTAARAAAARARAPRARRCPGDGKGPFDPRGRDRPRRPASGADAREVGSARSAAVQHADLRRARSRASGLSSSTSAPGTSRSRERRGSRPRRTRRCGRVDVAHAELGAQRRDLGQRGVVDDRHRQAATGSRASRSRSGAP